MAVRQMVGQLAWALQIEPQGIEGTFIDVDSAALLPRCLRHFVCARCWQEVHRAGRSMIIRKEWVLRMSWWCHLHDRQLSMAATSGDQATDRKLFSWLGKALPNAESLRWGLDYRPAMIARNAPCLDQLVRSGRRRMKGRNRNYFDRFLANQYHFTHDRIAMLALAHSHVGRAVWRFDQLVARGLAERPGDNVESLKQPKSARRAKVRWRTQQGRAQGRIVNVELLSVLRAYAQLQDRRISRAWAQSRFGHFPIIGP